jgi:hypothetical protein
MLLLAEQRSICRPAAAAPRFTALQILLQKMKWWMSHFIFLNYAKNLAKSLTNGKSSAKILAL